STKHGLPRQTAEARQRSRGKALSLVEQQSAVRPRLQAAPAPTRGAPDGLARRGLDAISLSDRPFRGASLPPAPFGKSAKEAESKSSLWHLLGRAEARREYQSEDLKGEESLFGKVEVSKALVLAADLGSALQPHAWSALVSEVFRLAEAGQLDGQALSVASQSLFRMRQTSFSPCKHGASTAAVRLIVEATLARKDSLSMRDLASVSGWLARLGQTASAEPSLRSRIAELIVAAAEQLPMRQAARKSVSGRDVGTLCEATKLLGLRSEVFLDYVGMLLRADWDMMWPPRSLVCAASCLAHFGHRDKRAWRALGHRVERELPVILPSALCEILESFSLARVRSESLEAGAAKAIAAAAANLGASDLTRMCRILSGLEEESWYGGAAEHEALLSSALTRALPRRAADIGSSGLRAVLDLPAAGIASQRRLAKRTWLGFA
ncbi:unnamed protein product, partial [Polarella glacialis]